MLPPGLQIWLARWTEVSELLEDDLMTREEVGTMFQALPKAKGRGSSSSAPAIDAKGFLEFSRKVSGLDDTSRLYVFWCFVSCPLIDCFKACTTQPQTTRLQLLAFILCHLSSHFFNCVAPCNHHRRCCSATFPNYLSARHACLDRCLQLARRLPQVPAFMTAVRAL